MKKKLIVMDMDGTLLNNKREMYESTKQYLRYLKEQGNIIAIATGRCVSRSLLALGDYDYIDYIVSDTGASIYNVKEDKIIYKNIIDIKEAKKIFNIAKENNCKSLKIFTSNNIYAFNNNPEDTVDADCINIRNFSDAEIKNKSIYHIAIEFESNDKAESFVQENNSFINMRLFVMKDSNGEEKWVEVLNKKTNKFDTIEKLAQICEFSNNDIICFGDAINDIEMIEKSGMGVAMKNAINPLKKVANEITEFDNENKGVEMWLKKYFGKIIG